MPSSYTKGRKAEVQVCETLQKLGWQTSLSPGSKGPADIMAIKSDKKWCIQVKFRANVDNIMLQRSEESELIEHSRSCGCVPIIAFVSAYPGGILMAASNVRDRRYPFLIRDIHGRFVAIELENGFTLFLFNMKPGKRIEP